MFLPFLPFLPFFLPFLPSRILWRLQHVWMNILNKWLHGWLMFKYNLLASSNSASVVRGMSNCSDINTCCKWWRCGAVAALPSFIFLCFLMNSGNASASGKLQKHSHGSLPCCFSEQVPLGFLAQGEVALGAAPGEISEQIKPKHFGGFPWLFQSLLLCPCRFPFQCQWRRSRGISSKKTWSPKI